ncbi:cytochrome c peroxidase [Bradyrhizobium sp. F1.13.3]
MKRLSFHLRRPFDQYLEGNTHALHDQQKFRVGAVYRERMPACHKEINIGGHAYFPFGVKKKPDASLLPSRR